MIETMGNLLSQIERFLSSCFPGSQCSIILKLTEIRTLGNGDISQISRQAASLEGLFKNCTYVISQRAHYQPFYVCAICPSLTAAPAASQGRLVSCRRNSLTGP